MSMWRLDYERVYAQVKVNESRRRLEWKPNELKDNIFELIAVIKKHRDLKMKGEPYLIKGKSKGTNRHRFNDVERQIYAWDFEYKGNPSRRANVD